MQILETGIPVVPAPNQREAFFTELYREVWQTVFNGRTTMEHSFGGKQVVLELPPVKQLGDFVSIRHIGYEDSNENELEVVLQLAGGTANQVLTVVSDCNFVRISA